MTYSIYNETAYVKHHSLIPPLFLSQKLHEEREILSPYCQFTIISKELFFGYINKLEIDLISYW